MNVPAPIRSEWLLAGRDRCAHGYFTRKGGVSSGIYSSLNVGLGTQDDPGHVMENRQRVAAALGAKEVLLATPHQTHSDRAVYTKAGWERDDRPQADGVVTDRPGVVLGVLTADCGPVLLADLEAGVIGAAHAGWRGASGGILESTVTAMEQLGARRDGIRAVLGPTISQENYEIGPELVARLLEADAGNDRFLRPSVRAGHAMFDLPDYILARLAAIGVEARQTGQCTYANSAEFFSYRRTTHRRESDYGRQISAIMLKG
jgi:YfiH family protein